MKPTVLGTSLGAAALAAFQRNSAPVVPKPPEVEGTASESTGSTS